MLVYQRVNHWIGFVGKMFTGNPWVLHVFTIKLIGFSGKKKFPSSNSMIQRWGKMGKLGEDMETP